MNATTIAPFVDAVAQIGEERLRVPPTRGELAATKDLVTSCPISIVVGVTGNLNGLLLIELSRESAMAIAEGMLGRKLRVLDHTVATALEEFGKRVTSNCPPAFAKLGLSVQLSEPALIRGTNLVIATHGKPALIVPLHFAGVGSIIVSVSIKRSQGRAAA